MTHVELTPSLAPHRAHPAVFAELAMNPSLTFLTATRAVSLPSMRDAAPARDHTLDVLGLDPTDQRVYFIERSSGSTRALPSLHFLRTRGWLVGRVIPAHAWYLGDPAEVAARFDERLDALLQRLEPLDTMAPEAMVLRTRVIKRRAVKLHADGAPVRRYELHLAARTQRRDVPDSIGRAAVTAYLRPRARIERVLMNRARTFALAMVSYVGTPDGIGSTRETAVLVSLTA